MKTLLKVFAVCAAMIVALVAVIKFIQKCSWKEAVGIAEEFWIEIRESCCTCCRDDSCDEAVEEV